MGILSIDLPAGGREPRWGGKRVRSTLALPLEFRHRTLTSTSASTVSTSASINITVDAGAALGVVFASVHAELNASVAKTVGTVAGNNYNVTIPPGKTAYGSYGVQVQVTTGNLDQSNVCGTTANYNSIQAYVPIVPGWCVWLSGETPCRVVRPS